jgi:hypothetical protein
MASLGSLVVSLAANTAQFTSAMDRAAYQQGQRMEQMERRAKIVGAAIGAAMLAGAAAIASQIKRSIDIAEEFERLGMRTEAVLKATGYSAGLTSSQIRSFSEEIALGTLASVEGVEAASQKLLTFKSVTGEVFKEAIRLSQDLAAVRFGTLESNVVQLGKALENPVSGIAALREAGVSFSATQKDLIENFIKTNDIAGAQGVVLEALRTQVGGAGAAEAGGLSGSYDTLGQNVQTFLRNVGNTGPLSAAKTFTDLLAQSVANYNAVLFKSGQAQVDSLVAERQRLKERQERFAGIPDVLRLGLAKNDEAKIDAINKQIGALQDLRIQEQIGARNAKQAAQLAEQQRKAEAQQEAVREKAAATKKIMDAAAKRSADLRKSIIASIEREAETFGTGARSAKLYELALAGASKTQIAAAKATIDSIEAMERQRDLGGQYGATMGQIASAIETADNSTRDLDAAQASLLELVRSPDWAKMPEAWQQTAIAQTAAASSAIKAAEAQAWLKSTMASTPTAVLDMARERMKFLADEYERGRFGIVGSEQAMREFGEVANTALGNVADEARKTNSAMDEFALQAARNMQDVFADFLFDPFKDGLDGMLKNFGTMLQRMIAEAVAADLANRIMGPTGNGKGGWIDLAMTAASAYFGGTGGGGASAPANISRGGSFSPSFDGGGSTGIGPRAGGIDGKGGFNAVLHPNETVIDHSKNQTVGAAQNVNITINMPSGTPAETRRAAGAGAREALGAFSQAQRYA